MKSVHGDNSFVLLNVTTHLGRGAKRQTDWTSVRLRVFRAAGESNQASEVRSPQNHPSHRQSHTHSPLEGLTETSQCPWLSGLYDEKSGVSRITHAPCHWTFWERLPNSTTQKPEGFVFLLFSFV